MIALIQRVRFARLSIANYLHAEIQQGFLVLLGVSDLDEEKQAIWLASKVAGLRIFSDQDGKMNLDLAQVNGEIMVVSQFTLLADAAQGNRPSYIKAARPEKAIPLYECFIKAIETKLDKEVKTGVFGADMQIELCNDGPVTIWLDTDQIMKPGR
jgi:D-tyrosyl-tRNA(Tyr) deacylase